MNSPRLRLLDIRLSDARIGSESLESWMETIPPTLHTLPIICLRLLITDICHALSKIFETGIEDLSEEDIVNTLPILLAKSIPSLLYLAVGIGGESYDIYSRSWRFTGTTSWWRPLREQDEVRLEPIFAETGERVMALIDSAEFEATLRFDGKYQRNIRHNMANRPHTNPRRFTLQLPSLFMTTNVSDRSDHIDLLSWIRRLAVDIS
ncbi:hypothetical protein DAEQUDRAFT_374718 [Daedalea quercina L-15889]|uniref:Uncharacterized protein n=1 Tax=Daedalea quercina L-15889 TaxID=1314783 RepID=A0A165P770_9APHY|nr:hypothetical protein DAEQUDRAFT_374718 [Daedalea quercina L-15889]